MSLLLSLVAVVVICFLIVLVAKSRRRDDRMLLQQNPLPQMNSSLDGDVGRRIDVALGRELYRLLEEGRKVEAVALVRERTGFGLKEAEEAVERLENLIKRMES